MHFTLSRTAPVALLALAAACAGGPGTGVAPTNQTTNTVLVTVEGNTTVTGAAPVASSYRTGLPVDSAMARLRAAYELAAIPVLLFDPATGRVGNARLQIRRALNHEPLSTFVDCGRSLTGTHADQDQLTLSIVSTVHPAAGGGSRVETLLTGSAQDRTSGNVSDLQPCTTRGTLESRLHRNAFRTP
jgi:hypothetical protein